jgi:hypothetical protein
MKPILTICALVGMSVGALAQTVPTATDPQEPVVTRDAANAPTGTPEITEEQAKSRIEEMGYSNVVDLRQGDDGFWRGAAEKGGARVAVTLDDKGNVTEAE